MKTRIQLASLTTATLVSLVATTHAVTTTITGTAGGRDSWNTSSNWDNGVPGGTVDVVVATGVFAQADNTLTPPYSGTLTLNANASLQLGYTSNNSPGDVNPLVSASEVTLHQDTLIVMRNKFTVTLPPLVLAGDATVNTSPSTTAHDTTRNFGAVAGAGTLTVKSNNKQRIWFNTSNPGWSGGLKSETTGRHELHGNAPAAFGTGDVSITPAANDQSASLYIDVPDVLDDAATLTLNGTSGQPPFSPSLISPTTSSGTPRKKQIPSN